MRLNACALALALAPLQAWCLDATSAVTVTQVLKTDSSWNGVPLAYPAGKPEVTGLIVEIAPGAETGWHRHAIPSFAYMLEGVLEVTLEDGRKNRLQAGQALSEVVNVFHNGRNVGERPVRLVVFYAGTAGQKLSEPKTAPTETK